MQIFRNLPVRSPLVGQKQRMRPSDFPSPCLSLSHKNISVKSIAVGYYYSVTTNVTGAKITARINGTGLPNGLLLRWILILPESEAE